jgi:bifunctional ADP-heptose synthase (sugar kinase/adenylyltransferase)
MQQETARAAVLASVGSVDLVVVFAEVTPVALIEAIRPDVLAMSADYRVEEVRRRFRPILWRHGRPRRSHCRPQHNGDDQ